MRKLISCIAIGVASLATVINCSAATPVQTITVFSNASGGLTYVTNSVAATSSGWQPIMNLYENVRNASNIAVAVPVVTLVSGEKRGAVGIGVIGIYNVNNYVGIGIGAYWMHQWYEFNGNVQLQYPMPLWAGVVLTPFIAEGIGTSFSGSGGANGDAVIISQVGLNVDIVNLGAGWELGFGG